ncbi:methylamine utilization protein MauJ [Andreprevotia chitinilytica]|uniref:methylamine utilization protein MauJ n=1 Tax=Andreprevotia chitinilytica TaxID=396808 RepID=UPI0012EC1BB1|nr:methylamine utilization protein MauJ [Andreprevotia chitinilytica]
MKTPYVPHLFGDEATAKIQGKHGWLTVGVVSSLAWPQEDVWLQYNSQEYLLRGANQQADGRTTSPTISTPCDNKQIDEALSRLYRFVSLLGYFKRGYVDITGMRTWAGSPILHVSLQDAVTTLTLGGHKTFSCNHLPIIEDDQVRMALAFLREGRRLRYVHEPYSFLSFFKVIESQFVSQARVTWVEQNLPQLDGDAAKRVSELQAQQINVNKHLYDSGRCAVAHASISGTTVDPDIPEDRTRIAADLDIIAALATRYVKVDAGVPDEMDLYEKRDRVAPWQVLMTPKAVETLKAGGYVDDVKDLGKLDGATVTIRLWPDRPAAQFQSMTLLPVGSGDGSVQLAAHNARKTIVLAFLMNVATGRMHTLLNESSVRQSADTTEQDVEDFARYFHSVIGNRIVELTIEGAEPVDCEVVIPINIIPQAPEDAVAQALEQFRHTKAQ